MKYFFLLIFILKCTSIYAQEQKNYFSNDFAFIAKNNKHSHSFKNGQSVKIYYRDNNIVTKVKGRISIINENEMQLIPFGRKNVTYLHIDSIISMGIWARKGKVSIGINAGIGIVGAALTDLLLNTNPGHYDSAGNIILLLPLAVAVIELYVVSASIAIVLLREILSKRSEKNGYHFSIETIKIGK